MNAVLTVLLDRVAACVCGQDLWGSAQAWVGLYEREDLTGAEKRARVLAELQEEFADLGKTLAASLFGFAIEAALQYVRRRGA